MALPKEPISKPSIVKRSFAKPSSAPTCTNGGPLDVTLATALMEPWNSTRGPPAGILLQHNHHDHIRNSDSNRNLSKFQIVSCHEISIFLTRPIWRENIARLDDPSTVEIEFPFEARVSSLVPHPKRPLTYQRPSTALVLLYATNNFPH